MHMVNFKIKIIPFFIAVFAFFSLLTGEAIAQNIVQINENSEIIDLKNIPYFKDKTNVISFYQARSHFNQHKQYIPPRKERLNLGYEGNIYWFKLSAYNFSQFDTWYFSLHDELSGQKPAIKKIHIYDIEKNGEKTIMLGAHDKGTRWSKNKLNFPIQISPNERRDILIMVETMDRLESIIKPRLIREDIYREISSQDNLRYFIVFSVMLAIATIGITLFFYSNLIGLIYFSLYNIFNITSFLLFDGIFTKLINYFSINTIENIMLFMPALSTMMALLLAQRVINFDGKYILLNYLMRVLCGLVILFGFIVTFVPTSLQSSLTSYHLEIHNLMLPLYASIVIMIMSVFRAIRYPSILIFTASWLSLIIGYFTPLLSYQEGFVIHTVILTLYILMHIKIKAAQLYQNQLELKHEYETKVHAIKLETETEKQALQRKRENEKSMLQDLRQRDAIRAHELKIAKASADEANKAKSDFLAMISHEIRTPMTGIMGMVQLTLESDLNKQQREYVETIKYSGETLLTLLNDILDFAKIESGHLELENVRFNIRRLIESVTMLMSGRANEKGLKLKNHIDDAIPEILTGDPNRIRQILLNLLSNAIKFTQSGHVETRVKIQEKKGGIVTLSFAVIDTGIGISKTAQDKLFGAYQQADETISRQYGGTGLGLNICKMLTEAMGGEIEVESETGKGSNFSFTIPLKISDKAENSDSQNKNNNEAQETKQPSALKILSVDDNTVNLKVMSGLLTKDGHDVTSASSAQEALSFIKESGPYDIVLADMRMPDMSGPDLCREIRASKQKEISKIPVIAVTGNTQQKDIDECYEAGMNGFITKPPSLESIRNAIKKLFDPSDSKPAQPTNQIQNKVKTEKAQKTQPGTADMAEKVMSDITAAQNHTDKNSETFIIEDDNNKLDQKDEN